MPIYEYACSKCDDKFEVLVRGAEQPACPTCGSSKIERQLSVPAAHTGSARQMNLPVCQSDTTACGGGFCRTGNCDMD